MSTNVALFDDEFLKKLEYLNILSKRLFAGHCSFSWTKVVSTCEGFSDVAAFSRIQPAR